VMAADLGARHRLPHLGACRLAALEKRQSDDGNGGIGASVDRALR